MTKKALLARFKDHPVTATMIGGTALEDWPEVVERGIAHGWHLDGDTLRNGTGFVMKPKLNRIRVGKFTPGSSQYSFTWGGNASYGSIKDLKEVADGLELTMFDQVIMRYTA
jgi:galactose mutarotase-like enzyme